MLPIEKSLSQTISLFTLSLGFSRAYRHDNNYRVIALARLRSHSEAICVLALFFIRRAFSIKAI